MAHFVERRFHRASTIDSILVALDPPRGLHYRYDVPTKRGTTESVYVDQGDLVLCDMPAYTEDNSVTIYLTNVDGTHLRYALELPFSVIKRIDGSERLLTPKKIDTRIERSRSELTDYLENLRKNPEIDSKFAEFVRQNNIVLDVPDTKVAVDRSLTPKSEVDDLLPREHVVDGEVAMRYFIKIALMFGAHAGPAGLLNGPVANLHREFLQAVFVPSSVAVRPTGENWPFFLRATVDQSPAYAWAGSVTESIVAVNTSPDLTEAERDALLDAIEQRKHLATTVAAYVNVKQTGSVDLAFHEAPTAFAFHELELRSQQRPIPGTWCEVRLFGGIFTVDVLLSEDCVEGALSKRVDVKW